MHYPLEYEGDVRGELRATLPPPPPPPPQHDRTCCMRACMLCCLLSLSGVTYSIPPSLAKEKTRKRKHPSGEGRMAPAEGLARFMQRSSELIYGGGGRGRRPSSVITLVSQSGK